MRRITFIFILAFLLLLSFGKCDAQIGCTTQPGYQCITNETADKIKIMKIDYDKAQILIADLQQKIKDSDLSAALKDSLIARYTKLADLDTGIEAKQQAMLSLLRDEIKDYEDEVARLKKQLGQGKGKLEKLLGVLKIGYYVLAGAAIVIGL